MNSDKSATRSGLVGQNLTVLDLKTSCWALSASVRWTKRICRHLRAAQPIRKCYESHVNGIGAILILNDPVPSLNAVSCDKKSASVRQADGLTNFNLHFQGKKSASVRQPSIWRLLEISEDTCFLKIFKKYPRILFWIVLRRLTDAKRIALYWEITLFPVKWKSVFGNLCNIYHLPWCQETTYV